MAVFTKISDDRFREILGEYDIGNYVRAEGISEGVENTNYRIFTDQGKFILTVYEKRVNIEDLPFFLTLQEKLNLSSFPCPCPIRNKLGNIINDLDTKKYTIVSFINGKWPKTITNSHATEAGKALALLHNGTESLTDLKRKNSMQKDFWLSTYDKVKNMAEDYYPDLKDVFSQARKKVEEEWPKELREGIIHADYFPDNVMFAEGKVSGVIDFYMACNDLYTYDLAIALNAWCFEKDYSFNITKAKLFLNAYNNTRKLNENELSCLPILCVGASMRFLSTRLYDKFNHVEGSSVTPKDPKEYIEKLKFHMQVSSFFEYGI